MHACKDTPRDGLIPGHVGVCAWTASTILAATSMRMRQGLYQCSRSQQNGWAALHRAAAEFVQLAVVHRHL